MFQNSRVHTSCQFRSDRTFICVSVSSPFWCKFCSWEAKSRFGNILFLFLQISRTFSLKEETVFYALFFLLNIANSCPEFTVIVVIMLSTHWSLPQSWAFSSTLARLNDFFLSIVDGGCSFVFHSQLREIMTQKLYNYNIAWRPISLGFLLTHSYILN